MAEIVTASAARVRAMRARRTVAGLVRLELYAHPHDHAALKKLAERLAKARAQKGSSGS